MSQLKTIDLTGKSFEANGKIYFIEQTISFERFLMYQKLQIECAYETGFYGLHEKLKEVYELCNKMKFADIAVLVHNILSGVKSIDNRKIPVLSMCALFMNTAEEDRKIINDDMVDKKIADWEAEGLDIIPFLQFASNSISGFLSVYKESIQDILNESQKTKN